MTSTLSPPISQMNEMDLDDRDDIEHHPRDVSTAKLYPAIVLQPSRLIELPDLPRAALKSKRYYFYGWYITPTWLAELGETHRPPRLLTFGGAHSGLKYLRAASGYKHCHWVDAAVRNDGEVYEETSQTRQGKTIMNVIAITTNAIVFGQKFIQRRPTEEQLAKLVQIFGRPPRWFKDGRSKKHFPNYDMAYDD